jgi:hypothetical protein
MSKRIEINGYNVHVSKREHRVLHMALQYFVNDLMLLEHYKVDNELNKTELLLARKLLKQFRVD